MRVSARMHNAAICAKSTGRSSTTSKEAKA